MHLSPTFELHNSTRDLRKLYASSAMALHAVYLGSTSYTNYMNIWLYPCKASIQYGIN